jgi:outer membrane protein OmpA-like peptidoglycan-associated protein
MASPLFDLIQSQLGPNLESQLAGAVGLDPANTRRALDGVVPALLAGAAQTASTQGGAERLLALIREVLGQGDLVGSFGSLLASGSLLQLGRTILSGLFGSRIDTVATAIGTQAGIPASSASSLLATVAPLVLGTLGRQVSQRGLSPGALGDLLASERGAIASRLPAGLAGVLGGNLAGVGAAARAAGGAAADAAATGSSWMRRALPALLALLAALFLYSLLRSPSPRPPAVSSPPPISALSLPGGAQIAVPVNSINDRLARFLADGNGSLPKRFVFDDLNFDLGSPQPTAASRATIDTLAVILRAYPSSTIRLEGHTDSTGDGASNKQLSQARADAVKAALVQSGIDGGRIQTEGFGAEQPLASDATEEGRAQNRRTELVVTAR